MNLITEILASALAVATIHSVNSEIPTIDESPYSKALLCRGDEMSLELSITQRNFLSSFDNDNLSISNNGSFFTGSLMARDLFTINEISNFNAVYYHVDFDATYIAGLDVCIIEMTLVKDGTDFMKESVFVFPFETSNNERDAKIVINGCQFYKSDILDERNFLLQNPLISPRDLHDYSGLFLQFEEWLPGLSHNVNDPQPLDDPCGGGVLFPIIGISDAISGIDRVIGFGEQYINIPLISTTSMADWLFFDAKLRKTKENFDHNITAELPISKNRRDTNNISIRQDNHIFKQSDYTDWNFSFFGNLAAQGCGVIAVYNMLVDCFGGNYIDLPTLIALFETMNADTLFGCFGANMVPSDYVLSLALYLDALAVEVAVQSVATVVSIFSQSVSEAQNAFEAIALGILGVVTTVLTAEAAFAVVDLVFASTAVLTYYFNLLFQIVIELCSGLEMMSGGLYIDLRSYS